VNPWLVLCAAGCVSWLLRAAFIDLFPARKLPPFVRTALDAGGPAAITALLVTDLSHTALLRASLPAAVAATASAAAITARFHNLALTAAVGIAVYWLASLVLGWLQL
jgi:branched-subunit amino acid transport protein